MRGSNIQNFPHYNSLNKLPYTVFKAPIIIIAFALTMSDSLSLGAQLDQIQRHIACPAAGCREVCVQQSILPCGHALCRRCMKQHRRYRAPPGLHAKPSSKRSCPTCQALFVPEENRQNSDEFAQELASKLRKLLELSETQHQSLPADNRCDDHSNRYTYFCETCDIVGCGDCLLEQKHSGHRRCRLKNGVHLRQKIDEKVECLAFELDQLQMDIEANLQSVSDLRTSNDGLAKQLIGKVAALAQIDGLQDWYSLAERKVNNRRMECEEYTTAMCIHSTACHSTALKLRGEASKMLRQKGEVELALAFSRFVREVAVHKTQCSSVLLRADKKQGQCFDLELKKEEQLHSDRLTFAFSLESTNVTEAGYFYLSPTPGDDQVEGDLTQAENPYEELATIDFWERSKYERKDQARQAPLQALPPLPTSLQDASNPRTSSAPTEDRSRDEQSLAHDSGSDNPPSFPSLSTSSSDEEKTNATGHLDARSSAASNQQAKPLELFKTRSQDCVRKF